MGAGYRYSSSGHRCLGPFPCAEGKIPNVLRIIMKVMVFGFAAAALYSAGRPKLAILFGVCVLLSHGMDYVLAEK